jgi:hypothetical protein
MRPWVRHLVVFLATVVVVSSVLTPFFLSVYPALMLNGAHKAISSGIGAGPVSDNTVYTVPELASPETANGNSWLLGGNQDGLYTVGWLDLTKGPQLLTIPEMGTRYHNVALIAPRTGVVIANLKSGGQYVIGLPGSAIAVPTGAVRVDIPGQQVLLVGRTLVENAADLPAARTLAQQITVTPLK